jgi:O-antigen/teichoic acid export membrane protein
MSGGGPGEGAGLAGPWWRRSGLGATLARGASGTGLVQGLSLGLGFAVNVVLARLLGASGYGDYATVMSVVTLLLLVALFGTGSAAVQFTATYQARGDLRALAGFLAWSTRAVLGASLLVASLAAAFVLWLGPELRPELRGAVRLGLLLLAPLALLQLRTGVLRGFRRVVVATVPEAIARPLLVAAGLLALWAAGVTLDGRHAVALTLAATALLLGLVEVVLAPSLRPVRGAVPRREGRRWAGFSLSLLLVSGFYTVVERAPVVLVGLYRGTEAAGLYNVASQLGKLVTFGLSAITAMAMPLFAELHATGRRDELRRLLGQCAVASLLLALPAAALLGLGGGELLGWFGPAFPAARGALRILVAGQLVNALTGPVGVLLVACGHERGTALVLALGAGLDVALCLALIPGHGIDGAAVATALALGAWNLALAGYAWRRLGLDPTALGAPRWRR